MKIGDKVNFFWPGEEEKVTAEVVKIHDKQPTPQHMKILDLQYTEKNIADGDKMIAEGVHHKQDAAEGEPFWTMKGERVSAGWADVEVTEETPVPTLTPVEDEDAEEKPASRKKGKTK